MSENTEHTSAGAIGEIEQGPSKFDQFLDKNQKNLIFLGLGLILAVGAFIIIKGMKENKRQEASAAFIGASDATGYKDVAKTYENSAAGGSALVALANAQWNDDKKEAAVETLKEFIGSYPEHPSYHSSVLSLATKLSETGNVDEAASYLQQVIDSEDPSFSPIGQFLLADIKFAKGEKEESVSLLEDLLSLPDEDLGRLRGVVQSRLDAVNSPLPPTVKPEPTDKTPEATAPVPE